jgi:Domain of Unknown Function (DUF1206)
VAGLDEKFALLARSGYVARGVVYLIVGGLAVLAAFGKGGQTTDTHGALTSFLAQPFGNVLLAIVALGLIGYVLWRVVQALADVDHHGNDPKGLAIRGGLLVSAATHSLLALFALSLVFGWGSSIGGGDGDSGARDGTAWLMQQPFGRWLVGLIGLAIVGAGVAHMVKGYRARFQKYLQMDAAHLAAPVCRFGLIARGVVFVIIGAFLIVAAVEFDSAEARGLQGALHTLQQQPYGWILLGIVALGLAAFGVYSLIEARYRRIEAAAPPPGVTRSPTARSGPSPAAVRTAPTRR